MLTLKETMILGWHQNQFCFVIPIDLKCQINIEIKLTGQYREKSTSFTSDFFM